jgi:membrane protein YqaA with SNARE-associated domain
VAGGLFGYAIGYFLYETLGQWLINLYGMQQAGQAFRDSFAVYGLWVILVKGLTPIPYKLVTIVSGAAAFDIWVFIAASLVTRGVRFYAEVALLKIFGERIRKFVEKYLTWVAFGFLIFVVGGFIVAAKFL